MIRLRTSAHGTVNSPGASLVVGPKGGLGEHGDAVSRQLVLTKVSLVERRPENYEVSWCHIFWFQRMLLKCSLYNMVYIYLISMH